ncbi:MAG: 4-hydroxythreonine-4-phosphate dehydrogenase PdxA [Acidithiobacillus sp.]|nr:4-hydroxythreonine-4-phosphate dehydrogenase PdxA [Acidithiobacillus sp.]
MKPTRILVSVGEPAGIGPDLCLGLAAHALPPLILIGDPECLRRRSLELGIAVHLNLWQPEDPWPASRSGELTVFPVPLARPCRPGKLETDNARAVLAGLDRAVALLQAGLADALVTAPVHKGIINDAGIAFRGHTEYLAERCGSDQVLMLLAGRGLRVALATTHLPLRDVANALTQKGLERSLRILHQGLRQDFGIDEPRILVAGLNPHAGEGGHLGREEIEIIQPVLETLQREEWQVTGPWPADTLFTPKLLEDADAVLAMYHDQGLPVLKYHAFGEAANITLGLPIIRTSVDHGTALDLAGSGRAEIHSLLHAIQVAANMVRQRRIFTA